MDAGALKAPRALVGKGRRPSVGMILVAAGVAVAMLVGGTYLWQHAQVRGRQAELEQALAAGEIARERVSALEALVGDLQGRIGKLLGNAEALKARFERATGSKQRLAQQLDASERRLRRAEARMTAMLGSPLADGRYFGRLLLVGVDQAPPRLVIDVEQFFTGPEADQAAAEDGVLPAGEQHVPNDVYIRNENPQWRVVPVDLATEVSLVTYPFGQVDAPGVVTLGRFGKLFDADRNYVAEFPYWITVRDGVVVAIEEQYIP